MDPASRMWSFLKMVFFFPVFLNRSAQYIDLELIEDYIEIDINKQERKKPEQEKPDEKEKGDHNTTEVKVRDWFEQEIDSDVKWGMALNRVEFQGATEFQNLTILGTKRFGKAVVIDGHLQSTEVDEYIYHESLVHPALLIHNEPKTVFIMGGGGGSAAREALKHNNIRKVMICDIDKEISKLIREHVKANHQAFNDKRLQIVYNDAKDELKMRVEKFDVIIGDLPDPNESGPANDLYTKSFYERVAKPRLKENGIFVTQAGPAGVLTHKAVFSPIFNTLKQVFTYVIAYTALVPSYGDSWGWILASNKPIHSGTEELNKRIGERIRGELSHLDGHVIIASTVLSKTLKNSLKEETRILTEKTLNLNVGFVRQPGVRNKT